MCTQQKHHHHHRSFALVCLPPMTSRGCTNNQRSTKRKASVLLCTIDGGGGAGPRKARSIQTLIPTNHHRRQFPCHNVLVAKTTEMEPELAPWRREIQRTRSLPQILAEANAGKSLFWFLPKNGKHCTVLHRNKKNNNVTNQTKRASKEQQHRATTRLVPCSAVGQCAEEENPNQQQSYGETYLNPPNKENETELIGLHFLDDE